MCDYRHGRWNLQHRSSNCSHSQADDHNVVFLTLRICSKLAQNAEDVSGTARDSELRSIQTSLLLNTSASKQWNISFCLMRRLVWSSLIRRPTGPRDSNPDMPDRIR